MFRLRCAHTGCDASDWEFEAEGWVSVGDKSFCPQHLSDAQSADGATSDIVGFTEPEDGAEDRYVQRRATRPWVSHTVWWIVHNAIAHPLIAFVPVRAFFRFHDWTSHKMHGK
jgi:hypothetical protein